MFLFYELILKNLECYKLHNNINENINGDDYNNYCTLVNLYGSQYNGCNALCRKFERNLKKLHAIIDKTYNKKHCRHFNYLLYY